MDDTNIIQAIKNKKKIRFNYRDKGARIVAPHALYFNLNNEKMLDAFQFEGYSETGGLPDWRQFFLEHVNSIEVLSEDFDIAEGYNPSSARYINSICKL